MYINNEWVKSKEEIYNDDGSRIVTSYEVNEDGIYTKREEKTYIDSELSTKIESEYVENEWVYKFKYEYIHNEADNSTKIVLYYYSEGEWVLA